MDYKKFQENLDKWIEIYEGLDEDTRFEKKKKATPKQVEKAEEELGCVLPEQLRNFFPVIYIYFPICRMSLNCRKVWRKYSARPFCFH